MSESKLTPTENRTVAPKNGRLSLRAERVRILRVQSGVRTGDGCDPSSQQGNGGVCYRKRSSVDTQ